MARLLLLASLLCILSTTTSFAFHVATPQRIMMSRASVPLLFAAGPRSSEGRPTRGPRSTRERRERPVVVPTFDGKALATAQEPNEDAQPLDLKTANLKCMSCDLNLDGDNTNNSPCFEFKSLDDIHEGLSAIFNSDSSFRDAMRLAMRRDIFDTTPAYANLSDKAASIMLLPDSSLQGSWRTPQPTSPPPSDNNNDGAINSRMTRLTAILREALGDDAPTGDELLHKIGALCGTKPSTHYIDIVGVQNRKLSHSWHLDTGLSPENSKTVLWGFPAEDNYTGCGIFSHLAPIQSECHAPNGHPRMEPILFDGTIDEAHIVRPAYAPGKELLVYRDIDVLHSSPDVAFRTSVMRFM
jgi:hypothetical protein